VLAGGRFTGVNGDILHWHGHNSLKVRGEKTKRAITRYRVMALVDFVFRLVTSPDRCWLLQPQQQAGQRQQNRGRAWRDDARGWVSACAGPAAALARHEHGNRFRTPQGPAEVNPTYNPPVARFRLTLEYAGTRYSGWQRQRNARTVQGELDRAVAHVTGRRDFELYGSGRTDAGVHASAQVAHLDVVTSMAAPALMRALNDELPVDINVLEMQAASRRFHARHSAVARRYLYQIATRRTAFAKPYVWWVKQSLDLTAMRAAAATFVGMKDFQSFAATDDDSEEPRGYSDHRPKGRARSTVVLVTRLDVLEADDLVLIVVQGSHFLWKMVRRIVGVLVEIGRGGLNASAAETVLTSPSDVPARLTAPASGLFLDRVFYEGDSTDVPVVPPTPLRFTKL